MPSLEHDLRRYGSLLDDAGDSSRPSNPGELTTAGGVRRGTRTAAVAVAAVVIVSLIAVFAGTRSTHEPTPATTPIVAPTTTNPQVAIAQEAAQRARAEAWIAQHGGRAVAGVDSVLDIAVSDRAVYTWSLYASDDRVGTLSRVDRKTLHIRSMFEPTGGGEHLTFAAGALYLLTSRRDEPGWQLQRLDPDTLEVRWTVPFADTSTTYGDPTIAAEPLTVWVSVGHDIELLDAGSGQVLRTVNLTLPTSHTGAFLTLDPAGQTLYTAFGAGDGSVQPLQIRDPLTGDFHPLDPTGNETAAGGFTVPRLAATNSGVWLATQTNESRGKTVASFFRASGLVPSATLTVGGDTGRGIGLTLDAVGGTLWDWNASFIACADARTGHALGAEPLDHITADAFAADSTNVVASISGTLGIFTPHDLCRAAQ